MGDELWRVAVPALKCLEQVPHWNAGVSVEETILGRAPGLFPLPRIVSSIETPAFQFNCLNWENNARDKRQFNKIKHIKLQSTTGAPTVNIRSSFLYSNITRNLLYSNGPSKTQNKKQNLSTRGMKPVAGKENTVRAVGRNRKAQKAWALCVRGRRPNATSMWSREQRAQWGAKRIERKVGERTQFSIRLLAWGAKRTEHVWQGKTEHKKPSIRLCKGAQDDASSSLHVMDARLKIVVR